uniref:Protein SIEVE ELEMENT OCCLUSION B-like n=1 Tax=Kalanchoe fedtschenkoi TaxID=63787 RepID=A0A7N0URP8_KALFE
MSTEEDTLLKQIIDLHKPDGREIDVKSLLQLVRFITLFTDQTPDEPSPDVSKTVQSVTYYISELHKTMQDRSKGEGTHDTFMSLLPVITKFSWDAKLVLVLASFAMNHGVWMMAKMYSANSPALKDKDHDKLYKLLGFSQPKRLELDDAYYFYLSLIHSFSKRPKKNQLPKPALTELFQALTRVAECIIQLHELPAADLEINVPAYFIAMFRMPVAVYGLIKIVVHCAAVVTRFPSNDYEISVAEEKELSEYADQLNRQSKVYTDLINACNRVIEEIAADKAYQIPEISHVDNREALEFLIKGGDDKGLHTVADTLISRLKGKHVLLLVSDEESPREEIFFLKHIYQEAIRLGKQQLSILWVPVNSGLGMGTDHQFKTQSKSMPWYSVPHPSLISEKAAKFIKENWRFQSKTNTLVVLDPQGTVVNINAFHMLWIWGTQAFPFTRSRERALWRTQDLNMEFLMAGSDPRLIQPEVKKYTFLYGGDDIEWVRKFTTTVKRVADDMGIPLELMYVGKSSKGDRTKSSKIENAIRMEKLSFVLDNKLQCWLFWTRLRSMLISKMSHQRGLESEDWTTRQLKWLLGYETEKSWAVLGDGEVTHGLGSTVLQVLTMCDKTRISEADSFIDMFRSLKKKVLESERVCCQVEFPIPSMWMPDMMRCPDPGCKLEMMDERIVFQCCHPSPSRTPTRVPDLM